MAGIQIDVGEIVKTFLWGVPNKKEPNQLQTQRIECFQKMIENQKKVCKEKKDQNNVMYLQKEYFDLYTRCEEVMKP